MRKILFLIGLSVAIGCSAQTTEEFQAYIAKNKPLAESGQIPWSFYYYQLLSRMIALNAPGDMLTRANRLVVAAEMYEAGHISKDEFESRKRAVLAEQASADEARQNAARADAMVAQQESASRNQQQRSENILALAAQLLQAGQPQRFDAQPERDYAWAWDLQRGSNGALVWVCRGIQSGQYAQQSKCQYKWQNDSQWPGY